MYSFQKRFWRFSKYSAKVKVSAKGVVFFFYEKVYEIVKHKFMNERFTYFTKLKI